MIPWKTLEDGYGVSKMVMNVGAIRYRQGKSSSWRNERIGGRVHVDYDTIPSRTRAKLPSREELIQSFGESEKKKQAKVEAVRKMAREHLAGNIAIELSDRTWYEEQLTAVKQRNDGLASRCLHDYPRISAWYRWVVVQRKASIGQYGFGTMGELYAYVMEVMNGEDLHNCRLTNERALLRKLKPYRAWAKSGFGEAGRAEALGSVMSGKLGTANSQKMTAWHVNQLVKLARDGRQLNPVLLHQDITLLAQAKNKKTVCVETIRRWMYSDRVSERIARERVGKMKYMNGNEFVVTRDKASVPDALWWIDGTPEELWYVEHEDGKRKMKRLEVVKVLDDYSQKIVGYAIGKENQDTVYRAVKQAVQCKGTIAYQLVSDHGAALKSLSMRSWFKDLFGSGGGYGHTPTGVGRARAKVIEPMQAHFRQQMLARDANHSFGNITSKGAQKNDDFVKENYKDFPQSREALEAQIARRIDMWNERADGKGNVPNALYEEEYDNRRRVSSVLFASMFYVPLPKSKGNKYTAEGLKFELDGKVYRYIAPVEITPDSSDDDCRRVAVFLLDNAGKRYEVRIDPDDMSKVALYYDGMFQTYGYRKRHTKRALYDTTPDDAKLLHRYRKVQQLQQEEIEAYCRANDEYIEAHNMAKVPMSMAQVHKNERNDAHTDIKQLVISGDKEADEQQEDEVVEVEVVRNKFAL